MEEGLHLLAFAAELCTAVPVTGSEVSTISNRTTPPESPPGSPCFSSSYGPTTQHHRYHHEYHRQLHPLQAPSTQVDVQVSRRLSISSNGYSTCSNNPHHSEDDQDYDFDSLSSAELHPRRHQWRLLSAPQLHLGSSTSPLTPPSTQEDDVDIAVHNGSVGHHSNQFSIAALCSDPVPHTSHSLHKSYVPVHTQQPYQYLSISIPPPTSPTTTPPLRSPTPESARSPSPPEDSASFGELIVQAFYALGNRPLTVDTIAHHLYREWAWCRLLDHNELACRIARHLTESDHFRPRHTNDRTDVTRWVFTPFTRQQKSGYGYHASSKAPTAAPVMMQWSTQQQQQISFIEVRPQEVRLKPYARCGSAALNPITNTASIGMNMNMNLSPTSGSEGYTKSSPPPAIAGVKRKLLPKPTVCVSGMPPAIGMFPSPVEEAKPASIYTAVVITPEEQPLRPADEVKTVSSSGRRRRKTRKQPEETVPKVPKRRGRPAKHRQPVIIPPPQVPVFPSTQES